MRRGGNHARPRGATSAWGCQPGGAPAIARFKAVTSAPRVTARALMRIVRSQLPAMTLAAVVDEGGIERAMLFKGQDEVESAFWPQTHSPPLEDVK